MRTPQIQAWRRGDAITASRLDQPRKAFDELLTNLGAQGVGGARTGLRVMQVEVVTNASDILTCSLHDADGIVTASSIAVAKPYLLRNSITARGTATYTYSATDTREATVSGDTEDQVVVPSYIAGDVLYIIGTPVGGTDVSDSSSIAVSWVDMNVDGRAWAKVAV